MNIYSETINLNLRSQSDNSKCQDKVSRETNTLKPTENKGLTK
jgi:hypothetical protein